MPRSFRPRRLVVVAGTATDIGKTWVGARLIEELRDRDVTVAARKPAQSFDPNDVLTDAHHLGNSSGETPEEVCPPHRWYPVAMAPPMAAEVLAHEPLFLDELVSEVRDSWPGRAPDVGLVELAGGPRSPMAIDGDGVDLAERLAPDLIVLVADASLGTINAVRLAVEPLAALAPTVVVLNRFDDCDDLHNRNLDWLAIRDGLVVVTEVDALVGMVLDSLPTYCTGCGRVAGECEGGCVSEFDPPRFCPRCGRRMAVTITPTGTAARCRDHGELL
jgi:dethiobiotin synthetase